MDHDQVMALVERADQSWAGCGSLPDNRNGACRFEDPWRLYAIDFDPSTRRVVRKRFYFKHPTRTHL